METIDSEHKALEYCCGLVDNECCVAETESDVIELFIVEDDDD